MDLHLEDAAAMQEGGEEAVQNGTESNEEVEGATELDMDID